MYSLSHPLLLDHCFSTGESRNVLATLAKSCPFSPYSLIWNASTKISNQQISFILGQNYSFPQAITLSSVWIRDLFKWGTLIMLPQTQDTIVQLKWMSQQSGHIKDSRLHEECTVCVRDSTSIDLMSLKCYRPKIACPLKHTGVIG